jgi:hypothetical protein
VASTLTNSSFRKISNNSSTLSPSQWKSSKSPNLSPNFQSYPQNNSLYTMQHWGHSQSNSPQNLDKRQTLEFKLKTTVRRIGQPILIFTWLTTQKLVHLLTIVRRLKSVIWLQKATDLNNLILPPLPPQVSMNSNSATASKGRVCSEIHL